MKSIFRAGILASLVGAFGLAPTQALAAEELRLGMITPPSHVWTQAGQRFAKQLAEETNGEVTVQVFPGGQLGSETDMLQQMQSGVLDMGWLTAAVVSNRLPSYFAWFTPFLFDDVAEAIDATNTEAAQEMLEELKPLGIEGQGYMFAGMRQLLMESGTVESEEDLNRKKVRVYPFPATQVWYQAIGAVPTPMGLTEVYQSFDNGLLDAVDIDFDALVGLSMHEVASSLTVTNHMSWPAVNMIATDSWNRLTPEQQATFQKVLNETIEWAAQEQIQAELKHLETVRNQIEVLEFDDVASRFQTANEAFNKRFESLPSVKALREQVEARKAEASN